MSNSPTLHPDYVTALLAAMPNGFAAHGASGEIIEVNRRFSEQTGYAREELIGRGPPFSFWPERDPIAAYAASRGRDGNVSDGKRTTDLPLRRKDGSTSRVIVETAPVSGGAGGVGGGWIVIVRDVDRERQWLDELLADVPGVVWEAYGSPDDARQRINFVSKHVEKMLGYTVDEWLATPNFWLQCVHPNDRDLAARESAKLFDAGVGGTVEFRWVAKDGRTFWVEASSTIIKDEQGAPIGSRGVILDISGRKQFEQSLRERALEMAAAAWQLKKTNDELDQFAYITSHDLRAPLRGIANLSMWIEEDMGERMTPEAQKQFQLLRGRVHRMEKLIDGILEYSRAARTQGKPQRVDVAKLLAEVVDLLAPEPPARVEVVPGMPTLETDRVRLQQVFLNPIGNALKHAARPDALVRVSHAAAGDDGDFVEFSVADNGPGIAPQYHEKIFVIFQTLAARDKVESTGVGLALVKKIVESFGGAIRVDSTPGSGATFTFTWPTRLAAAPTTENPKGA